MGGGGGGGGGARETCARVCDRARAHNMHRITRACLKIIIFEKPITS